MVAHCHTSSLAIQQEDFTPIGHHFSYKQKKIPLLCLTTTIWIPSSIAIIAWTHTPGAFYGMSPKYCTLLWYVPSSYWG
jgi:hypothetical protein